MEKYIVLPAIVGAVLTLAAFDLNVRFDCVASFILGAIAVTLINVLIKICFDRQ